MFEPKIDVRAYDHDRFYRHDERFKALTMPAVEILEFPRHSGVLPVKWTMNNNKF